VHAHGLDRLGRGILAPQRHGEALGAHRLVGVQEQHRQQRPALLAAQPDGAAVAEHFERTENPELHLLPYQRRYAGGGATAMRAGDT
jgi:hypothetical protein